MPNELKPCPFCGGGANLNSDTNGLNQKIFWVECAMTKSICKVIPTTWRYKTKEDAIEAWNERADNG